MIKRLEIWNFENHEHALFDKFSPGFSLVCGESNAGKTSLVRALRLVAYNKFEVGQVRLGAKFCEVECETEKGTVRVKRGKGINEWIITPIGQKAETYTSVGKAVLEDVEQILGLRIVRLGEIEIEANIMEQLESHFMMSEVSGKDATGSLRAQIIDEISGLSGIEQLIKDVSLDNLRMTKEVKNLDDENNEIRAKLHDESQLEALNRNIATVEQILIQYSEDKAMCQDMGLIFNNSEIVLQKVADLEGELSKLLPEATIFLLSNSVDNLEAMHERLTVYNKYKADVKATWDRLKALKTELDGLTPTDEAESSLECAQTLLETVKSAGPFLDAFTTLDTLVEAQKAELRALPDLSMVDPTPIKEKLQKMDSMGGYVHAWLQYEDDIEDRTAALAKLPDLTEIDGTDEKIAGNLSKVEKLTEIQSTYRDIMTKIDITEKQLDGLEQEYHQLERDNEDILGEFDVCPFCNQEILSKV